MWDDVVMCQVPMWLAYTHLHIPAVTTPNLESHHGAVVAVSESRGEYKMLPKYVEKRGRTI